VSAWLPLQEAMDEHAAAHLQSGGDFSPVWRALAWLGQERAAQSDTVAAS